MTLQLNSIKKALVGTLAAVPLVVAGTLTSAGSVNAAALVGDFHFDGDGTPPTTATLKTNEIDFTEPGQIELSLQSGSFTNFNYGFINDLKPINSTSPTNNPFMDLVSNGDPLVEDGFDVFNLSKISEYTFTQKTSNIVAISVAVFGDFISKDGDKSKGEGILTFSSIGTVSSVKAAMATTGVNSSLEGLVFTAASVPEPASILGLGVVGGALVASRRRKVSQAS